MDPSLETAEKEEIKNLAASVTWKASKQTYYTIRLLVDRDLVAGAFRAYAYFRWLDDRLDTEIADPKDRIALVDSQKAHLEGGYAGLWPQDTSLEERMLHDLIWGDQVQGSGLQIYLQNMMAVMDFDSQRRGRLITQDELNEYTRLLASAVTEAMHHFVGHRSASPHGTDRYLAVSGAHVVHMLRDTLEDTRLGYYNIPCEYLKTHKLDPEDVNSPAYCRWVESRVRLARRYFAVGKQYLSQVENLRCRIAGYAYIARFEGVLDAIERDAYALRPEYPERKTGKSGLTLGWSTLMMALAKPTSQAASNALQID